MASKSTTRSLQSLTRQVRQKCSCAISTSSRSNSVRQFSAAASRSDIQHNEEPAPRPRWSYTPPQMKLPFDPRRIGEETPKFECNSDPAQLDKFYTKFLGRGGDHILTEEVKWLAITHKSFDQGRRGFNDRLAFLGRRILNLQATLALLHSPPIGGGIKTEVKTEVDTEVDTDVDSDDDSGVDSELVEEVREPFTHPALVGLPNLQSVKVADVIKKERVASLAAQLGMAEIIRWEPRLKTDFKASGLEVVLTTSMYAIVGAIALQKGGAVAARVARERVLKPLGI